MQLGLLVLPVIILLNSFPKIAQTKMKSQGKKHLQEDISSTLAIYCFSQGKESTAIPGSSSAHQATKAKADKNRKVFLAAKHSNSSRCFIAGPSSWKM